MKVEEALVELKTQFSARGEDSAEKLQGFIVWFMENTPLFLELYGEESGKNARDFSIKLTE